MPGNSVTLDLHATNLVIGAHVPSDHAPILFFFLFRTRYNTYRHDVDPIGALWLAAKRGLWGLSLSLSLSIALSAHHNDRIIHSFRAALDVEALSRIVVCCHSTYREIYNKITYVAVGLAESSQRE